MERDWPRLSAGTDQRVLRQVCVLDQVLKLPLIGLTQSLTSAAPTTRKTCTNDGAILCQTDIAVGQRGT